LLTDGEIVLMATLVYYRYNLDGHNDCKATDLDQLSRRDQFRIGVI
jgi:hypothetical protein